METAQRGTKVSFPARTKHRRGQFSALILELQQEELVLLRSPDQVCRGNAQLLQGDVTQEAVHRKSEPHRQTRLPYQAVVQRETSPVQWRRKFDRGHFPSFLALIFRHQLLSAAHCQTIRRPRGSKLSGAREFLAFVSASTGTVMASCWMWSWCVGCSRWRSRDARDTASASVVAHCDLNAHGCALVLSSSQSAALARQPCRPCRSSPQSRQRPRTCCSRARIRALCSLRIKSRGVHSGAAGVLQTGCHSALLR